MLGEILSCKIFVGKCLGVIFYLMLNSCNNLKERKKISTIIIKKYIFFLNFITEFNIKLFLIIPLKKKKRGIFLNNTNVFTYIIYKAIYRTHKYF